MRSAEMLMGFSRCVDVWDGLNGRAALDELYDSNRMNEIFWWLWLGNVYIVIRFQLLELRLSYTVVATCFLRFPTPC